MSLFLIDLKTPTMWLATIDASRVSNAARSKLLRYQKEGAQALHDHFYGKPPEDPIIASLQAALQVRQSQLALEKKVEVVNRVASDAKKSPRLR